jgi:hypothetical protein
MTPEAIQSAIEFYHSIFVDRLKSDPEGARRFIRAVKFGTPEQILESNELVFAPDSGYRQELRALLEKYSEVETLQELIAVMEYEQWKTNPTSEHHE